MDGRFARSNEVGPSVQGLTGSSDRPQAPADPRPSCPCPLPTRCPGRSHWPANRREWLAVLWAAPSPRPAPGAAPGHWPSAPAPPAWRPARLHVRWASQRAGWSPRPCVRPSLGRWSPIVSRIGLGYPPVIGVGDDQLSLRTTGRTFGSSGTATVAGPCGRPNPTSLDGNSRLSTGSRTWVSRVSASPVQSIRTNRTAPGALHCRIADLVPDPSQNTGGSDRVLTMAALPCEFTNPAKRETC